MKKLVVFDLDGTLHHTERALAPAIARAAADITGDAEPEYGRINALYGEPLEIFCRELTGRDDQETFQSFMGRVRFHQAKTIPESGELYPGVREMLKHLKDSGFDLAVLSNAHMDYIEEVTEQLGIRDCFFILSARSSESSKTARLAELSSGYDFTVMVGDRYHDIQAALENSIPAIACSYGYGSSREHAGAAVVKGAEEIPELINRMLSVNI